MSDTSSTSSVLFDHPSSAATPTKPATTSATSVSVLFDNPTSKPSAAAQASVEPATQPRAAQTPADALDPDNAQADALYDGGAELTESAADTLLGSAFDTLEYRARYDQVPEDAASLLEGRRASVNLLIEDGVGQVTAKELTTTLAAWNSRPAMDDAALNASTESTMATLRRDWGPATEANIAQARQYLARAEKRLPWLADLVDAGAGSDLKFIKAIHQAAKASARSAKR